MDIWVCEYSTKQKVFHIDTLERVLAVNRQTAAQGMEPGYVILCAAATSEDAHAGFHFAAAAVSTSFIMPMRRNLRNWSNRK